MKPEKKSQSIPLCHLLPSSLTKEKSKKTLEKTTQKKIT